MADYIKIYMPRVQERTADNYADVRIRTTLAYMALNALRVLDA